MDIDWSQFEPVADDDSSAGVQAQFASLAGAFPDARISSLTRSPEHNADVGGVKTSQHIPRGASAFGTAMDIVVPKDQQADFQSKATGLGFQALNEGDHIHLQLPKDAAASNVDWSQFQPVEDSAGSVDWSQFQPAEEPSFANVQSGAVSSQQPAQAGDTTGLKGLYDDVVNFPENFATGAKALWEGGNYEGQQGPTVGVGEGFLRRAASDVAALPGMALSSTPVGWGEKALKYAAQKAGVDLPDWATPLSSGVEAAQKATGAGEMQYASPREEAIANIAADALTNFLPIGEAAKAEAVSRDAFQRAAAEGKPHWDATKDALDAIQSSIEPPVVPPSRTPDLTPTAGGDAFEAGKQFAEENKPTAEPPKSEFEQAAENAWTGKDPFEGMTPVEPTEAPTERSTVGPSATEPSTVGTAPEAAQAATEPSGVEAPLSDTAQAIKAANEKSISETGNPLSPDQIRSIREQASTPANPHNLDLWEDTVKELGIKPPKEARSKVSVAAELSDSFGSDAKSVEGAVNNGRLRIISADEVPNSIKSMNLKNTPNGWLNKDGSVTIVADNLPHGYVRPLIFHEIGAHGGIQQTPHFPRYVQEVRRLVELKNKDALRAVERIEGQRAQRPLKPHVEDAELLAYFVQHVSERMQQGKGIVGSARNAYGQIKVGIKNYLNQQFGMNLRITDKDMYYFALGQIKKFGKEGAPAARPQTAPAFDIPSEKQTPRSGATPKEAPPIQPEWKRRMAKLVSWKGGDLFAHAKEEAKHRGAEGDFLADRSARLFDKAGFRHLDDAGKELVRKAMQGDDTALSALTPKLRNAVSDTRQQIQKYQAELAGQGIKMGGKDMSSMLYESLANGDYLTRSYGVYEIKPALVDRIGYALSGAEKQGKPFWRYRQEQKHPAVVESLKKFIAENLIDPNSNKPIQHQVEDILNDLSDPRGKQTFEVTKQAARDSSILERRTNVPKPIRQYWNEFTDPRVASAFTISRLAALTAKQGMLNRIAKEGEGKLFFDKENAPVGFREPLPTGDDYGPLAGKYTRPDIANQLTTQLSMVKDSPANTFKDAALGALDFMSRKVLIPTKVAKTVLSPATNAVNWYANSMLSTKIAVQHAMMGKALGIPEFGKAIAVNLKDLFKSITPEEASTLIRYGILRDGAQFGELKKVRSRVEQELEFKEAGPIEKVGRYAAQGVHGLMQATSDFYQLSDNTTRAHFFLAEMTIQKKLHPDWTQKQLVEYSANVARDEVPTWGRASPTVKGTSRVLGNFATWSGEVIRSYKNQIVRGTDDLVHGETPAQKYYGMAQLLGTSASMAAASTITPKLISWIFGLGSMDDEKKNNAMTKLAADYQGGDALTVADADPKSGKIVYMDATRLDASSPITTARRRAMQAWEKDKGFQKTLKNLEDAGWGWLKDQFFNFGPALQAAKEITTGVNQYGKPVDTESKLKDAYKAFEPGGVATFERIEKMKKRGVAEKVINAQKAGLPLYELDTRKQSFYAAKDVADNASQLKQFFTKSYGKEDTMSDADLKSRYKQYVNDEYELWRTLNDKAQALKTILGDSAAKSIVEDAIKEAKLPKAMAEGIKTGKFQPGTFPADYLSNQEKNAIYADPSHEQEIKRDFANRRKQLQVFRRNFEQLLEQ